MQPFPYQSPGTERIDSGLRSILERLASGQSPTAQETAQLRATEQSEPRRLRALELHPDTLGTHLKRRIQHLQTVYPSLAEKWFEWFGHQNPCPLDTLWSLWLPLTDLLIRTRNQLQSPLIQGVLGAQGTGKTTLGLVLTTILKPLGYSVLSLSLDDFYKPYAELQALKANDRRFIWRGPPGTHDLPLALQTLDALGQPTRSQPVAIPRFDKSAASGAGDRRQPDWLNPDDPLDVVLFEGWMVGVQPLDPEELRTKLAIAPPPLHTESARNFAQTTHTYLRDYVPLWQRLHGLWVLHPVDYRLSKQWRQQAEAQRIAAGGQGLSPTEIEQFVEYFWQALHPEIFLAPLIQTPGWATLVVDIQADHSPGALYYPGD